MRVAERRPGHPQASIETPRSETVGAFLFCGGRRKPGRRPGTLARADTSDRPNAGAECGSGIVRLLLLNPDQQWSGFSYVWLFDLV